MIGSHHMLDELKPAINHLLCQKTIILKITDPVLKLEP